MAERLEPGIVDQLLRDREVRSVRPRVVRRPRRRLLPGARRGQAALPRRAPAAWRARLGRVHVRARSCVYGRAGTNGISPRPARRLDETLPARHWSGMDPGLLAPS